MKVAAGRCYIVTGGGSGLGAAVAATLMERNANVVVLDMKEDQGQQTVQELNQQAKQRGATGSVSQPSAIFVKTDVTSEGSPSSFRHLMLLPH